VDRDTITTGWGDVAHVSFEIVDSSGTVVPTADHQVGFTVAGGSLVLVDNANLRDLEPYRKDSRQAFHGRGLAIVRADRPGTLRLTATADGLPPASVILPVVRGPAPDSVPAARHN
jgi:beta-galactosidase